MRAKIALLTIHCGKGFTELHRRFCAGWFTRKFYVHDEHIRVIREQRSNLSFVLADILVHIHTSVSLSDAIFFFLSLQAVRATTGDLTAVIGVSARMGRSVTPSQVPVSALMDTRDGVVRNPVNMATMAKHVSCPASVSMVAPVTTWQESAFVHQGTQGLCEY